MNWKNKENNQFTKAILAIETPYEARAFLRDIMTESEINEFGKRLKAAEMLTLKAPYSTIEQKTGLSSTTVARVSKWLNGKEGGYQTIIGRLHHHNSIQTRRGLS